MTKLAHLAVDLGAIVESFGASPYDELYLAFGRTRVRIRRTEAEPAVTVEEATAPGGDQPHESMSRTEEAVAPGAAGVLAPATGTFYRAPHPGAPPFCQPGRRVDVDDTLCLIEVMKLFASVRATVGGTVRRIAAKDGAVVRTGQLLFEIEPD